MYHKHPQPHPTTFVTTASQFWRRMWLSLFCVGFQGHHLDHDIINMLNVLKERKVFGSSGDTQLSTTCFSTNTWPICLPNTMLSIGTLSILTMTSVSMTNLNGPMRPCTKYIYLWSSVLFRKVRKYCLIIPTIFHHFLSREMMKCHVGMKWTVNSHQWVGRLCLAVFYSWYWSCSCLNLSYLRESLGFIRMHLMHARSPGAPARPSWHLLMSAFIQLLLPFYSIHVFFYVAFALLFIICLMFNRMCRFSTMHTWCSQLLFHMCLLAFRHLNILRVDDFACQWYWENRLNSYYSTNSFKIISLLWGICAFKRVGINVSNQGEMLLFLK